MKYFIILFLLILNGCFNNPKNIGRQSNNCSPESEERSILLIISFDRKTKKWDITKRDYPDIKTCWLYKNEWNQMRWIKDYNVHAFCLNDIQ